MGRLNVYCAHVWVEYIADPQGGKIPYEFCHRCRTTYMPGSGLVKKPVVIGYIDEPNQE